ncbi:Hypothetical protein CINCED_3A000505 [Cinara cedri]|uniref:BRISC and BRCA1-A complex member 1 n=1 Tax=Cinara cedri TaxID=506608 RepID=A0A5E4MSU4_9HEMI|nr:Hypothetical protein CINCED_3A000505 [Cinara cedri]
MSYANALSKNKIKTPTIFKNLPNEKILFVVDSYALSRFDIDLSPTNLVPISSLTVIKKAIRLFALEKNRFQNHSFGICVITSQSFNKVLDFTSNLNTVFDKLLSISIQLDKPEEVASYDFGPLLKYVRQMRNMHKDSIFRVIMTYNRDDCLPIIEQFDKMTFNIFCSRLFFFDIVYVCENNIETDEMAQNNYGKLALLGNPWSFKVCVQRKPFAIINGIMSLLPHPFVRGEHA